MREGRRDFREKILEGSWDSEEKPSVPQGLDTDKYLDITHQIPFFAPSAASTPLIQDSVLVWLLGFRNKEKKSREGIVGEVGALVEFRNQERDYFDVS
jgi:hypothetical protein